MSPCGCQSVGCGCNVQAGAGIAVQRIGDTFHVSATGLPLATPPVVQVEAGDATIDAATDIAIFNGPAASVATLPPATAGSVLEVWNHTQDFSNLTIALDGADAYDAATVAIYGDPLIIVMPAVARFVCVTEGEWMVHAFT